MAIPGRIDWDIWRIASAERFPDGLIAIQTTWSLDDLYEAHDVLDLYDELDRKVAAARQEAQRR